jgi:hypothetical protein
MLSCGRSAPPLCGAGGSLPRSGARKERTAAQGLCSGRAMAQSQAQSQGAAAHLSCSSAVAAGAPRRMAPSEGSADMLAQGTPLGVGLPRGRLDEGPERLWSPCAGALYDARGAQQRFQRPKRSERATGRGASYPARGRRGVATTTQRSGAGARGQLPAASASRVVPGGTAPARAPISARRHWIGLGLTAVPTARPGASRAGCTCARGGRRDGYAHPRSRNTRWLSRLSSLSAAATPRRREMTCEEAGPASDLIRAAGLGAGRGRSSTSRSERVAPCRAAPRAEPQLPGPQGLAAPLLPPPPATRSPRTPADPLTRAAPPRSSGPPPARCQRPPPRARTCRRRCPWRGGRG